MKKDREKAFGGNFVVALIFFVLIAATGFVLLITTLVAWLAELMGSVVLATLIVCGACIIAALLIYLLALRRPLARMQDQLETVYEVARLARSGYDWVQERLRALLNLREAIVEILRELL